MSAITLSETTEEDLVALAQADDEAAFRELFDRFYPMIYAFSYRACLSPAQAEDITQETWIKAARSLKKYRGDSSFKTWIYRIASNNIQDWIRGKSRRERMECEVLENAGDVLAESEPDLSRVTQALHALPDDLRLAIVLTFYEGMNHAQAGAVLGCAEATVSWRVFRAKQKLKKILSRSEVHHE